MLRRPPRKVKSHNYCVYEEEEISASKLNLEIKILIISYKLGLNGWALGARSTSVMVATTFSPGRNTPFL